MDCRRVAARATPASLATEVWALLLQLSFDGAHRHFGLTAAELQLSPTQAMALHELEVERPVSMRELAQRLKSDPSTITGLIDRLVGRGFVERRPDPRDRRVTGVALTREGEQLRERLVARLYAAPRCVADLPERDQRTLHDLLARIVAKCALTTPS